MRKDRVDMLSGSITKSLLSMIVPIMLTNVLTSLMNITDMTVLKIFSNEKAVGAVGACGALITLCTCLLIGISTGANVIVAKRIGAGDKERADKATMTAIMTAIVGGLALMVIGVLLAEPLLNLTNCPEGLMPQAIIYFRLYFVAMPLIMLNTFFAAILRATGDIKRPTRFSVTAATVKLVFTVFFAAVVKWDVEGVAIATLIAQAFNVFLYLRRLLKHQSVVEVDFKKAKFDFVELKEMLHIGIPAGVQSALYSFANVVIVSTVNSFGEAATTGISIANQFDGILYQVIHAPSVAVAPFVGQNMGARNIKRVKATFLRAVLIVTAFGATCGALSATFSRQLASIMSDNPEAIEYARQKMIIVSSTYFISGINEVLGGVLRGIGKPIIPTVSTLIFMCALRFVWVYVFFPLVPNMTFLYAVWPVGWVLCIITGLVAYFITMRKHERNMLAASPAQ